MKKIGMSAVMVLVLGMVMLTSGCASAPNLGPAIMQSAVAGGVSIAIQKDPNVLPYMKAAQPVVCNAAGSGTLDPAAVVAALQASSANELKTPSAVIAINMALSFYEAIYYSYGSNVQASVVGPYLQATCNGLTLAIGGNTPSPNMKLVGVSPWQWPHVE